ncbi:hypothetical protein DFH09DRAFT_1315886 [Mycena vulgaris]|nr:hypothetical protein DFH09DRAFT_1315886 [Mycena vulgaris]
MNFIKFGNHVIAPAGAEPGLMPAATVTTTSDSVAEVLGLARLLQSKIKDLEKTVAEGKARCQEWRTGVSRLDKILVALREQDSKEGEKLAKLSKRWNKTTLTSRHDLDLTGDAPRYMFDLPHGLTHEPSRCVCTTTQAASAFNGNNDRYRDTYTFTGSAWQAPRSPYSSAPSSPAAYPMDERKSFHLAASPEGLDTRRDVESFSFSTPTQRDQIQRPAHRAVLSDIRNAPQDNGEGDGRKRKTADFEAEEYDGSYKKSRVEETRRRSLGRRGSSRRNSRRSGEHSPNDTALHIRSSPLLQASKFEQASILTHA